MFHLFYIANNLIILFGAWWIIRELRADNKDLRDRMYVSKGQPPTGVNMKEVHDKQEGTRLERLKTKLPAIGPLQRRRMEAIAKEATTVH